MKASVFIYFLNGNLMQCVNKSAKIRLNLKKTRTLAEMLTGKTKKWKKRKEKLY